MPDRIGGLFSTLTIRRRPAGLAASLMLLALSPAFLQAGVANADDREPAAAPSNSGRAHPASALQRLLQRLEEQNDRLAEQNAKLAEQNARLSEQNQRLELKLENIARQRASARATAPTLAEPPAPDERKGVSGDSGTSSPTPRVTRPTPDVGPSEHPPGQVVIARNKREEDMPFELRADLFSQVRYSYFAERADEWTDSAGNVLPLRGFDSLELTRNFIQLSGYAIDRRLQFTANLFSSTALNSTNYLGWINYQFNRAIDIRAGNWIVPGTREWLESFRYTLGADRLMATTFFRPNISPGIWAQGEPLDNLHYVLMFANSLNRFNQGVERIGNSWALGGTLWWEPFGPFGPGPSDIEHHVRISPRIGTNFAFGRESNQGVNSDQTGNPEDTILRLSDGTPLFRLGSLAPGVELRSVNVNLWTVDLAMKYRGFALSGEYFLRWLDGFEPIGGVVPLDSLFDHGALLQTAYFVLPGTVEGFARSSFVSGHFGGGYEVGGGVNWYIRGNRDWRMTVEVLNINRSPAQNLLTGYRAGESGTLYQLQLFTDFF